MTLFLGKNLVFVPECHSTMDLALQLCQQSAAPEGTLVITDHQTAGRGQRGNTWITSRGENFTLTLVLRPGFLAIKDQFYLTMAVALGLHDYLLTKTNRPVRIKWPNDILVDDKKVCGILIENQLQGQHFTNSLVGIGLNINQQTFAVSTATSLSLVTGQRYELAAELPLLLAALEARYLQLREGRLETLKDQYLNNLYWRGEQRSFTSANTTFNGTITGIDASGKLKVETMTGLRTFDLKEIAYVR
jgi:BirA family biotin operon repressor/biotin-[acetyl-CoA-carboxylase] ligase